MSHTHPPKQTKNRMKYFNTPYTPVSSRFGCVEMSFMLTSVKSPLCSPSQTLMAFNLALFQTEIGTQTEKTTPPFYEIFAAGARTHNLNIISNDSSSKEHQADDAARSSHSLLELCALLHGLSSSDVWHTHLCTCGRRIKRP